LDAGEPAKQHERHAVDVNVGLRQLMQARERRIAQANVKAVHVLTRDDALAIFVDVLFENCIEIIARSGRDLGAGKIVRRVSFFGVHIPLEGRRVDEVVRLCEPRKPAL
jgi:hypothetical protein